MPFFALAISQKAQIHLSNLIGLSSKIVPTRIVNCFLVLQCLHVQSLRVEMKLTSVDSQRGHVTMLSGHRTCFINSKARSVSAKYLIAPCSVVGNWIFSFMHPFYSIVSCESS